MKAQFPALSSNRKLELDNRTTCKQYWVSDFDFTLASVYREGSDEMVSHNMSSVLFVILCLLSLLEAHGPPLERDNEDIAMGRKVGAKWCSLAKVCNHDRIPVCRVSHAGDVMGFRDHCDMFDYNCIRRRNYKQTACPDDRSVLTVSRRPTNSYYDD